MSAAKDAKRAVTFKEREKNDKAAKHLRAQQIVQGLSERTAALRKQILVDLAHLDRDTQDWMHLFLDVADSGAEAPLAEYGINFEHTWAKDIVAAMVQAKPALDIQTLVARSPHPTSRAEFSVGLELSKLVQCLRPATFNARLVFLVYEFMDDTTKQILPQRDRDNDLSEALESLEQAGLTSFRDVPEMDYLIVRASERAKHVDAFIEELQQSGNGVLVTDGDGSLYFGPSREFVENLALHSELRKRELSLYGTLLKYANGIPTSAALNAAEFLDPLNKHIMHLTMLEARHLRQQDHVYALLRAAGRVTQSRYHNIFFDPEVLTPAQIAYATGKVFHAHAKRLLASVDSYGGWPDFDLK
ncbi:MAG TPA: hypothetical protein VHQ86_05875 [Candidatus Saccharimonadia bacterium]|nr:hypothetical protein [Candidatus Saccharimonadia bacterium]